MIRKLSIHEVAEAIESLPLNVQADLAATIQQRIAIQDSGHVTTVDKGDKQPTRNPVKQETCERPPQPDLTALIASRVDTFQPVFKEATHGTTGRSAEGRGMAAAAAAVHGIRHNVVEVLRSSGCIGHRFPLLAAKARSAAA